MLLSFSLVFVASFFLRGQQTPSSFAKSARATSTNKLVPCCFECSQTRVCTATLTPSLTRKVSRQPNGGQRRSAERKTGGSLEKGAQRSPRSSSLTFRFALDYLARRLTLSRDHLLNFSVQRRERDAYPACPTLAHSDCGYNALRDPRIHELRRHIAKLCCPRNLHQKLRVLATVLRAARCRFDSLLSR